MVARWILWLWVSDYIGVIYGRSLDIMVMSVWLHWSNIWSLCGYYGYECLTTLEQYMVARWILWLWVSDYIGVIYGRSVDIMVMSVWLHWSNIWLLGGYHGYECLTTLKQYMVARWILWLWVSDNIGVIYGRSVDIMVLGVWIHWSNVWSLGGYKIGDWC